MNTIRIYQSDYSAYQANTNPMTDIPEPSRLTLNGNGLVPSGEWIEARACDALKAELVRLKAELAKAQNQALDAALDYDRQALELAAARLFADDAKRHVAALADAILVMFGPYTIADIHGNILIAADELDQAVDSARSAREWLEGKKAEGERMKAEGTHD